MTIHDPKKFCDGLWDWGILDGCFGQSKIKPTDIDGFVERRGKFLVLETKQAGARIPYGQGLTFEALRRTGIFTVFIVWGEANKPVQLQMLTRHKIHNPTPCDVTRLRAETARWYQWADQTPTPAPVWALSGCALR